MEDTTYDKGQAFFDRKWADARIRLHSECVIRACLNTVKDTDLDLTVFIVAGWIHDIGRKIDKDRHETISIDFFHEFLEENPDLAHLKYLVEDCILNHRRTGKPQTIYGKVFQCADKVALHDKSWIAFSRADI